MDDYVMVVRTAHGRGRVTARGSFLGPGLKRLLIFRTVLSMTHTLLNATTSVCGRVCSVLVFDITQVCDATLVRTLLDLQGTAQDVQRRAASATPCGLPASSGLDSELFVKRSSSELQCMSFAGESHEQTQTWLMLEL